MITNPKRILWPTDFSPLSLEALKVAWRYAQSNNAELHAIHVEPIMTLSLGIEQGAVGLIGELELRRSAEKRLSEIIKTHCGNARVNHRVLTGTPWLEICNYAADVGIELIVISTHGLTGLKHVLLGSVAERVVQHAPCSVLVLKSFEPKSMTPKASE